MTNWLSRWGKGVSYDSLLWFESEIYPGVSFSVRKMSLGQRLELSARIRELTLKNEFLKAGELSDQMEARMADLMVQKLYVEWAVADIKGLKIDGKPGTIAGLTERGPEKLVAEMAEAIHSHLELGDEERKNS